MILGEYPIITHTSGLSYILLMKNREGPIEKRGPLKLVL